MFLGNLGCKIPGKAPGTRPEPCKSDLPHLSSSADYFIELIYWLGMLSAVAKEQKLIESEYWKTYDKHEWEAYVKKIISDDSRHPGRTIVTGTFMTPVIITHISLLKLVACGDAEFTHAVRSAVIQYTKPSQPIEFVESEYRPYALGPMNKPRIQEEGKAHVEVAPWKLKTKHIKKHE